jgi:hypothetical protein
LHIALDNVEPGNLSQLRLDSAESPLSKRPDVQGSMASTFGRKDLMRRSFWPY